jgi:hypothetical protein
MPIQVRTIYSDRCDTQSEISQLKLQLAEKELKLKGLEEQIAHENAAKPTRKPVSKLAEEIAEKLTHEEKELGLLKEQVDKKLAYISELKDAAYEELLWGF